MLKHIILTAMVPSTRRQNSFLNCLKYECVCSRLLLARNCAQKKNTDSEVESLTLICP